MGTLPLRRFDMSYISDDSVVVLIGKRNTGKSVLVADALYHHRDLPVGVVMSPTEQMNSYFGKIIPPQFIHDAFKSEIVDKLVQRQKMVIKRRRRQVKLYGRSDLDDRAFLLLDDCLYDGAWTKDTHMRFMFMNGRHVKTMLVITMQYPLGIPPNMRTNIDFTFILRENLLSNRKRIYENYAGIFPTFEIFCQVMDQCTENYECLVIHNNAKSNKLEDQVFWYRAEPHAPFRIGHPDFWEGADEEEAEDEDDDIMPGDVLDMSTVRRTSGPRVSVRKGPCY
jgi:hypothetical protein